MHICIPHVCLPTHWLRRKPPSLPWPSQAWTPPHTRAVTSRPFPPLDVPAGVLAGFALIGWGVDRLNERKIKPKYGRSVGGWVRRWARGRAAAAVGGWERCGGRKRTFSSARGVSPRTYRLPPRLASHLRRPSPCRIPFVYAHLGFTLQFLWSVFTICLTCYVVEFVIYWVRSGSCSSRCAGSGGRTPAAALLGSTGRASGGRPPPCGSAPPSRGLRWPPAPGRCAAAGGGDLARPRSTDPALAPALAHPQEGTPWKWRETAMGGSFLLILFIIKYVARNIRWVPRTAPLRLARLPPAAPPQGTRLPACRPATTPEPPRARLTSMCAPGGRGPAFSPARSAYPIYLHARSP